MIWTMALALTTWGTANLVCDLNGNNGGINLYGYVSQSPQCLRTHSDCNQISHLRTPPLPKPPGAGRKDGGPTGGRGPGAGGGGGNPFDRAKDALRCAASLSQAGSVNNITGKNIPIVGGNFFGDLTGAALGPEPGTDPTIGLNDRIDQGVNAVSEGVLHETVQHAVPQIAVGVFNGIGQPVSYDMGVAARFATQEPLRRAFHKRWMRQG